MSDTPKIKEYWVPIAEMQKRERELAEVTKQRDDLSKMISAFCVEQNWACSEWKNQTHIKPLFDFHASMKGGEP